MRIKMMVLLFFLFTVQVFAQGAGNTLQFDGGDDYVTCGHDASLNITGDITVEAWVYFTDFTIAYPAVVSKSVGPSGYGLERLSGKQALGFWICDGSNYLNAATNDLSANIWYHIAGTWSGNLISIYVDGILNGTASSNAPASSGTSDLRIGLNSSIEDPNRHFKGKIDEVRVWNTALSESSIRDWMHKEVTSSHPYYSNLKGYWKLNETSGTTTTDLSGNGNSGTLIGGPSWVASTVPLGSEGAFVNTTTQTNVGPSGGQLKTTISSTPDNSNNLGVYQFGSVSGEPVTGETYPSGIDKRSNMVWGITERGSVTANLVFDYSNVGGISDPSTIKLMKRTDASSTTWTEVTLYSRDNNARTLTVNDVTSFSEFALGAGSDNSLPVTLTDFSAKVVSNGVALSWTTESEIENPGFILEKKTKEVKEWTEIASYLTDVALEGHGTTTEKHDYRFVDQAVVPGTIYEYRLADVDYSGNVTWHKTVEIKVKAGDAQMPAEFGLHKAYPNPFNPAVTLRYGLSNDAQTTLQVYNMRGQLVETLVNVYQLVGTYEFAWQPVNLSAGVYILRLQAGDHTNLQKLVYVK